MTINYKDVYVDSVSTVVGPFEADGKLKNKFDKSYNDLYANQDTIEKAEIKMLDESIKIVRDKSKNKKIDLFISGDLDNQIVSSCYSGCKLDIPFIGLYSACATNVEGLILASNMINSKICNNILVSTCSHNLVSEKTFRCPIEYGMPKPKTNTFTATGAASCILTNKKTNIKIESSTIGKIVDYNQNNPMFMGACMASAAADTIYNHLNDLNRTVNDYDLILTGDLGKFGKQILIDYMMKYYNIDLSNNYDDCGTMLYEDNQTFTYSGGSGPVCSALVVYSDIIDKLKKKELKRVLYVATGALFNSIMLNQKENILGIAHAISLESV